jgi:hypothetical protein
MVTNFIFFSFLNPIALATMIVGTVVGMLVSAIIVRKFFSFKERLAKKIIADIGTRPPNQKRKKDAGGLLYKLWYGFGDQNGIEQELSNLVDRLWFGTQSDGTIIHDNSGNQVPALGLQAKRLFTDVAAHATELEASTAGIMKSVVSTPATVVGHPS